jgi:hypothetical protein
MPKPSVQLAKDADTIDAFLTAFNAYVEMLRPIPADPFGMGLGSLSGLHSWAPRPGCEDAAQAMRSTVAARAGAAATIAARSGRRLLIRPGAATGRAPIAVNPIEAWANPLEPASDMQIQTVRDFASQAAGEVRAEAESAAARESGPIWWIARFVRLPIEVREAAGVTSRAGQNAAAGVGIFIQGVAISVVAGIIVLLFQVAI